MSPVQAPERTTVATTATGHPKLPKLDTKPLEAEESTAVRATIASITGPVGDKNVRQRRLEQIHRIIDDATKIIDQLEPRVRKLALSLALHEGARGVYQAYGVSRSAWGNLLDETIGADRPNRWTPELSARATAAGVRKYRTAATELPEIAPDLVRAHARRDTARHLRDDILVELIGEGATPTDAARQCGVHPTHAFRILRRTRQAQ